MKKFRKIAMMSLAAIMAVSAMSVSAFAEGEYVNNDIIINNETGIQPLSFDYPIRTQPFSGNPINARFIMNDTEPYGKVWIENAGTTRITVTVTKSSKNGTRVTNTGTGTKSLTIDPGEQDRFWFKATGFDSNGEGVYYVNIGTSDGTTSKVNMGVRSADTESDLGE